MYVSTIHDISLPDVFMSGAGTSIPAPVKATKCLVNCDATKKDGVTKLIFKSYWNALLLI